MFDQYVALVQSADPAKRREAIIGFGKLGDSRAMKYLAQVYKTDADPALRDLAAKAGRHIQKVQQGGQAAAQPVAPSAPPTRREASAGRRRRGPESDGQPLPPGFATPCRNRAASRWSAAALRGTERVPAADCADRPEP